MPATKQRTLISTKGRNKRNTENLWLNIIITDSKFISSPFKCLFSTIIPKSVGFFAILQDELLNRAN